jgi:type IX secretion system PorP/SprF family membrane protein
LKTYLIILFGIITCNLSAQDVSVSMPFFSSQFLSPANAGSSLYGSRVQGNLKSQFTGNSNLFNTIIAGWDTKLNNKEYEEKNHLGLGFQIMSDQLLGGILQTNYLTTNFAYHLNLNQNRTNTLAMGMGLSVAQTSYDQTKLTFGDMYNSNGTQISTVSPNEILNDNPTSYAVNTGVVFSRHAEETFFQLGVNSFYYSMPELTGALNKLTEATEMRYNAFLNLEKYIAGDFTILVHGSYDIKGDDRFYFFSGAFGVPLNKDLDYPKRFYLGTSVRQNIALTPYIAIMNTRYNFAISYDIYNNGATASQIKQNGFELSFSHFFSRRKKEIFRSLLD